MPSTRTRISQLADLGASADVARGQTVRRDALIRDLRANGVATRVLAAATGLTEREVEHISRQVTTP